MKYRSTRGGSSGQAFVDVVLQGLAPDGGLYVPEHIPTVSRDEWEEIAAGVRTGRLRYADLAFKVMRPFIDRSEIPDGDLRLLLEKSYSTFRTPDIVPQVPLPRVHEDLLLMELFHGPTFAFKDVALQFLGNLFEYVLEKRKTSLTILGATSGDTGSAAIYGVRGKKNIDCVILYPHGRTSPTQELQMTTVPDENIHCVAVEGVFDDCQNIVKSLFRSDLKQKLKLGAVNSINWARILAQVVYYFDAAARHGSHDAPVTFVVPTGNFGDVLAGYYARQMGLPIAPFVVASNSNDILPRFFATGVYSIKGDVTPTLSPSMDIQISSNFERFLFDALGRDAGVLSAKMADLSGPGKAFRVSADHLRHARDNFSAHSVSEAETKSTILDVFRSTGEILCPHTAVGVCAARRHLAGRSAPGRVVSLATAHFGKFVDLLVPEMQGKDEALAAALAAKMPRELASLKGKAPRRTVLPATDAAVRSLLTDRFRARL